MLYTGIKLIYVYIYLYASSDRLISLQSDQGTQFLNVVDTSSQRVVTPLDPIFSLSLSIIYLAEYPEPLRLHGRYKATMVCGLPSGGALVLLSWPHSAREM